ncbi:UvrD/REP helicase [Thecamonas trahens ATCC 50062]|uniref:DNA 3'-5' helicase n=1 Tax=Thecamonas trahens ATCC 50062 TaxID=461836 RepID=A0A0L0DHT5_THETB|nr:UvrD/REP helicase [Thecamonas trahens ATCC 50062]KNC50863.1 UvrD/REP helicase [Thecamonas trahens ATCC 50062]|eukprot:XP_013756815.1 UvrD/REP helicase [Thecamonas trahens ATCC 50062]
MASYGHYQSTCELNGEQKQAVFADPNTSLLVLAGAGTGKTRTVTERVQWMMACGINPTAILVLAFTNAVASEMGSRIACHFRDNNGLQPLFMTVHGFAWALINHHPTAVPFREYSKYHTSEAFPHRPATAMITDETGEVTVSVCDKERGQDIVKALIEEMAATEDLLPNRAMLPHSLRSDYDQRVGNDRFEAPMKIVTYFATKIAKAKKRGDSLDDDDDEYVQKLWGRYNDSLTALRLVEFSDMVPYAVKMLRQDPLIRRACRSRFRYVVVDEAQDTSLEQWKLINMIAAPYADDAEYEAKSPIPAACRSLMVVGDADQLIYSFRGAEGNFAQRFSSNYRSHNFILAVASALIAKNPEPVQGMSRKPLVSAIRDDGVPVQYVSGLCADGLAKQIKSLCDNTSYGASDIAILCRAKVQNETMQKAPRKLEKMGIPTHTIGGERLVDIAENKVVLSYISLLVDPANNSALMKSIEVVVNASAVYRQPALTALEYLADGQDEYILGSLAGKVSMRAPAREAAKKFIDVTKALTDKVRQAHVVASGFPSFFRSIVNDVMDMYGYREHLMNAYGTDVSVADISAKRQGLDTYDYHIEQLFKLAAEFGLHRSPDIEDGESTKMDGATAIRKFLAYAELHGDLAQVREGSGVVFSTIHAAKGLEWPIGRLPYNPDKEDSNVEEERRLAHVAMTRAKDILVLVNYNERLSSPPSEFLGDIKTSLPEGSRALVTTSAEKWNALSAIKSCGKRKHECDDEGPSGTSAKKAKHA